MNLGENMRDCQGLMMVRNQLEWLTKTLLIYPNISRSNYIVPALADMVKSALR